MSELMVTPYAPYRDGIANYAVQEVAAARASGRDMEVLSPLPSAAQHHLRLGSALGMARLIRVARGYDRVTVQLYPELLFGACRGRRERLAVWGLLRVLCTVTQVELRIHEIEYDEPVADPTARKLGHAALSAAAAVTVHTEPEQQRLTEAFELAPGTVTLVDHGVNFARRTDTDRDEPGPASGSPATRSSSSPSASSSATRASTAASPRWTASTTPTDAPASTSSATSASTTRTCSTTARSSTRSAAGSTEPSSDPAT